MAHLRVGSFVQPDVAVNTVTDFSADGFASRMRYNGDGLDTRANYCGFTSPTLEVAADLTQTTSTTDGTTVVTGVGFQPQLVFMWTHNQNTTANQNDTTNYVFGAACDNGVSIDHVAISGLESYLGMLRLGYIWDSAIHGLTVTSMDSDGFTFDQSGGQRYVVWMAMRDDDGEFEVGVFDSQTGTGEQTVSTGIDVNSCILLTNGHTAVNTSWDRSSMCIGLADGSHNRTCAHSGQDNTHSPNHYGYIGGKALTIAERSNGTTPIGEVDTVTFGGGDMVLDWGVAPGAARKIGYIAFGGPGGSSDDHEHKAMLFHQCRAEGDADDNEWWSSDGTGGVDDSPLGLGIGCWAPPPGGGTPVGAGWMGMYAVNGQFQTLYHNTADGDYAGGRPGGGGNWSLLWTTDHPILGFVPQIIRHNRVPI